MTAFDLLVIGGGITGLAVARLASRNGYRCVVLERADLASGASSNSSHMLHGGLRYLEHGRFSLVREALAQRSAVSRMAPGLARPQRFLVPLYRGGRLPPWKLRIGLALYDRLAGAANLAPHSMARASEALALEPDIERSGLKGAGFYSDVVMDDARLAVAVGRDAAGHGAEIHTYTEACAARPGEDGAIEVIAIDRLSGAQQSFHARVVVNAAGPWADEVRRVLFRSLSPGAPNPASLLRPSRGIHLVYPRLTRGHAMLLTARADGRVFFVVPFGEHSLVGTTEVEVPSPPPPSAARPSLEEVRYLRDELARALPGRSGTPPLAVTSGLRPLVDSEADVGRASREHRVVEEGPVITVAGGKYTTFRVIARDALRHVVRRLGHEGRPLRDPADPLPAPLAPGAPLERIAEFAVEHEFARRLSDVVRRRTTLWLEPDRGRVSAPRIAAAMAPRLGWSAEHARAEFQSYDAALWEEESLLHRSREEPG
ncbi:MAG: glycerol-3-phosphate dehydrogenase/oxidase [Candidatus Eisenbacteria bacterium]|uniref:Glycerol-3-phosphate dehydrogenase/oxidase n=1 Tax=Eiseniibacteriota bacterium TaxID=2212470 RepID=A0A538SBX2_UNCEI|nr:MAG: glycerol-3-phosphate dehydrogenase/oxidase [Candidatus Eisenbacteria bacterium]